MRRCRLTSPTPLIVGLLTGLLVAILAVPLIAQPTTHESHSYYDITKEVTLHGTVESVLMRGEQGMIPGSHLMLETSSGKIDASLGKWGLYGKGALSVSAGQQVEVTGVMKTLKGDKEAFLVRLVKANGHYYTIRNAHGAPQSPQSRERAVKGGL